MALVQVQCPDCHRADVVQEGKTGSWDPALSLRQSRRSAHHFSSYNTTTKGGCLP